MSAPTAPLEVAQKPAHPLGLAPDKTLPDTFVGKLEPNWYCRGWNAGRAKYCKARAGQGTDHKGGGRCKNHSGTKDIVHGLARRYAGIRTERIRELIAEHANDPDPLDVLPELAAGRALFQDWLERYEEYRTALMAWHEAMIKQQKPSDPPRRPPKILDIADGYVLLDLISKMVERIERVRAANAISRADLNRVLQEMARVVLANVVDEEARKRINEGWNAIPI